MAIHLAPVGTTAPIDRLVHHSVVLELNVPSYRAEQARKKEIQIHDVEYHAPMGHLLTVIS